MRRHLALALLSPIPVLAVAWGTGRLADHLGSRIAGGLLEVAAAAPRSSPESAVVAARAPAADEGVSKPCAPVSVRPQAEPSKKRLTQASGRSRIPRRGIRVSASTVLRLANAGLRPSGAAVEAVGGRPAGLVLSGVSGLGIGMHDGDVLTRAAGRPALSPGDVVGVVLASRGAGAPEISGQFWRNGERWQLTVEQPYLAPRRAEEAPPQQQAEEEPEHEDLETQPAGGDQHARSPGRRRRSRG